MTILVLLFFSLSLTLIAQDNAQQEVNLGTQAYRKGQLDEAAEHFEKSVALAPENTFAHLYLATTYANLYVPGAETPDNVRYADKAIEHYKYVLDNTPLTANKISSAKGIAYLYLQKKKFDDAKQYYRTAASLDSNDAESYYSIAVIDWTTSNQFRHAEREKLHVNPDDSLPVRDRSVCAQVRDRNAISVQEGIDSLNTALHLRPDYDDAMAYMNLLYRERSDIQCDDPAARAGDLKTADEWAGKAMQVRQAKAEKAAKLKATKSRQAQAVKKDENSEPANPPQQ